MEFITIKRNIQTEIVEKKSKFIANLFPVESVEETEERVKEIRRKYHDARHHCMAYRIVDGNQMIEKFSDDGEPSGTAGAPMLNILQKNNLANLLIVVTRYFGGILLGTGGLVRAYSGALLKTIEESEEMQMCQGVEMIVDMPYSEFDNFNYYCRNNKIFITNVQYKEFIQCSIELEEDKKEKLLQDFETKKIILNNMKELSVKYITKSI